MTSKPGIMSKQVNSMEHKIVLDANVMLDFLLSRHSSAVDTAEIIHRIEDGYIRGYLTMSIIQITGYWLTKDWGYSKAKNALSILLNHFEVIDGNRNIALSALTSSLKDIKDALQYFTGIHHQMDIIISRDKAFKKAASPVLPIYTPEEYCRRFIPH